MIVFNKTFDMIATPYAVGSGVSTDPTKVTWVVVWSARMAPEAKPVSEHECSSVDFFGLF